MVYFHHCHTGGKLCVSSSGKTQPQLSQHAEPPWTDPGLKSGISVQDLISTLKKREREGKKKVQAGNELSNNLLKSSKVRKSHHTGGIHSHSE